MMSTRCIFSILFIISFLGSIINVHFFSSVIEMTSPVEKEKPSTYTADRKAQSNSNTAPLRILHIVTTLTEFNNGSRSTKRGEDRLVNFLLPVLKNTVESILSVPNWTVDVYLVLGFETLTPDRRQLIVDSLPDGVGLEVWENAVPMGYPKGPTQTYTKLAPHALARQHRFVIKDKLDHYDFFSAWEDDMSITSYHIQNFLQMTDEIEQLKLNTVSSKQNTHPVYGELNSDQLERLIPGFIRVEVIASHLGLGFGLGLSTFMKKHAIADIAIADPIPHVDPSLCCSLAMQKNASESLMSDQLAMWETNIKGLGVRHIPGPTGWVAFLPGMSNKHSSIDSYWSGTDGAFSTNKRPGRDANLFAQQAGFMATRKQILHFENACPRNFLPPFDHPEWNGQSGLKPQNVEFWSGGYQLFGRCYMQRILSLDPERFSSQLLFHSSNNKQRQINSSRFVKADDLLGQLYTVRDAAVTRYGNATQ